jgi:hypothetical protein
MNEPALRSRAAIAAVSAIFLLTAFTSAHAGIDSATKCESAKAKVAGKYAYCRLKAASKAAKKSISPDFEKCLDKFGSKWSKAEAKAEGACPSSSDEAAIESTITAETDALAVYLAGGGGLSGASVGARAVSDSARCQSAKLKTSGKYAGCRLTTVSKAIKKAQPPAFDKCDTKFAAKYVQPETKLGSACPTSGDVTAVKQQITGFTDAIATSLTGATTTTTSTTSTSTTVTLPARCGNGTIDPGEDCETDGDCGAGEACSVCCTCVDATCPDVMEWTMHAGTGVSTTSTDFDWGWTGLMYDRDFADGALLSLKLCAHTGSGPAACGEATVGGIDPSAANCRCSNDNRAVCDEPFEADADDCGGSQCVCYLAPPEPHNVPRFPGPGCFVRRLAGDIGGTWNVDTGAGALTVPLRPRIYAGAYLNNPCPTCDGDVTRNDGVRDGVCNGGENDGLSCDANSTDASFPAPGGGAYSYDCFPSPAVLNPVVADHVLTTGSVSLDSNVLCGYPLPPVNLFLACPCGVCGDDPYDASPCNSNGDCATCATNADCDNGGSGDGICDGSGHCECVRRGNGSPLPNQCATDGICNDIGGGKGECNTGPDESYCDGIVHANGVPIYPCSTNTDCAPAAIGVDAGNCTISERRRCFLDPIAAAGTASTTNPVVVAAYCTTGTGNGEVNSELGLPGPARLAIESTSTFRCAGAPGSTYPGCP